MLCLISRERNPRNYDEKEGRAGAVKTLENCGERSEIIFLFTRSHRRLRKVFYLLLFRIVIIILDSRDFPLALQHERLSPFVLRPTKEISFLFSRREWKSFFSPFSGSMIKVQQKSRKIMKIMISCPHIIDTYNGPRSLI